MANNNRYKAQQPAQPKSKTFLAVVATVLVFAIAAVALVGVYSKGFADWTKFKLSDNEQQQTSGVLDENGDEMESGKVYPMSSKMTFLSTSANATIQIEAFLYPIEATNRAVKWDVSFVNSESAWAVGKTATDYITVAQLGSEAFSNTAVVRCLAPFGSQIKLTVTSLDNTLVTANCIVNFAQRITSVEAVIAGNLHCPDGGVVRLSSNSDVVLNPVETLKYDIFTAEDTFTKTTMVTVNPAFFDYVKANATFTVLNDLVKVTFNSLVALSNGDYGLNGPNSGVNSSIKDIVSKFIAALNGLRSSLLQVSTGGEIALVNLFFEFCKKAIFSYGLDRSMFRITSKYVGKYSSIECMYIVSFIDEVNSIDIDNPEIVF